MVRRHKVKRGEAVTQRSIPLGSLVLGPAALWSQRHARLTPQVKFSRQRAQVARPSVLSLPCPVILSLLQMKNLLNKQTI